MLGLVIRAYRNTQIESWCEDAHPQVGLNQKGEVKRIKLWRGLLSSFKTYKRHRSPPSGAERSGISESSEGWTMKRDACRCKHIQRLRRSHGLATAVGKIRWRARHRTAALHGVLIRRHGRHAIRELQKQQRAYRQSNK
jgi:hypothetical protein